jgi:hypothetical protein
MKSQLIRKLRWAGFVPLTLCALLVLLGFWQGPPAPYVVNLTWVDSVTSGDTGQNVYRAPYAASACGSYAILPAGANIAPGLAAFTDSTVVDGASYCYGVTAIGGNGKESAMDVNSTNPVLIPPAPPTGLSAALQ